MPDVAQNICIGVLKCIHGRVYASLGDKPTMSVYYVRDGHVSLFVRCLPAYSDATSSG